VLDKAIPELCSAKGFERKYDIMLLLLDDIIKTYEYVLSRGTYHIYTLRPVVLIRTPAAKCALRSASILTALAQFAARAFLLAF
jgi:hypothetical protein